jgi:hypothetical protein
MDSRPLDATSAEHAGGHGLKTATSIRIPQKALVNAENSSLGSTGLRHNMSKTSSKHPVDSGAEVVFCHFTTLTWFLLLPNDKQKQPHLYPNNLEQVLLPPSHR